MPITSLYWAYGTSSEPVGAELDGTSANYGGLNPTSPITQIFSPIESRAEEVGNKWELFDRHLLATAALFRTDVSNARELIGSSTTGTITAGAAYHVQGIDLGAEGNITDKWSVYTGLVLMKTRVDHSAMPTQYRPAARVHRRPVVQRVEQIQDHRQFRSRRPGDLSLENLRRHAARGGSGHGAPELLALRRVSRRQGRQELEVEAVRQQHLRTSSTTTPSIKARRRSLSSRPVACWAWSWRRSSETVLQKGSPDAGLRARRAEQSRGRANSAASWTAAAWEDGRSTAGAQSAMVKNNEQLPPNSETSRQLGERVIKALTANPLFISAAIPRHIFPAVVQSLRRRAAFRRSCRQRRARRSSDRHAHPHRFVGDAVSVRARRVRRRRT